MLLLEVCGLESAVPGVRADAEVQDGGCEGCAAELEGGDRVSGFELWNGIGFCKGDWGLMGADLRSRL